MKFIRKVDAIGRVHIPVDARTAIDLNLEENVEIEVKGNKIIITKIQNHCTLCQKQKKETDMVLFFGRMICDDCIKGIHNTAADPL